MLSTIMDARKRHLLRSKNLTGWRNCLRTYQIENLLKTEKRSLTKIAKPITIKESHRYKVGFVFCREDERCAVFFVMPVLRNFLDGRC